MKFSFSKKGNLFILINILRITKVIQGEKYIIIVTILKFSNFVEKYESNF